MNTEDTTPLKILGRSFKKNTTIVDWYLGKRCNFFCSYCGPEIHDGWSEHSDIETLKSYALKLYDGIETDHITLNLVGGEPLIHPKINELLSFLSELRERRKPNRLKVFAVTNFSRSKADLLGMLEHLDLILASLHFQFIHKMKEKYVDKIISIYDEVQEFNKVHAEEIKSGELVDKHFSIRFMIAPGVMNRILEFEELLKSKSEGRDLIIDYRKVRHMSFKDLGKFKEQDAKDPLLWRWKKGLSDHEMDNIHANILQRRRVDQKVEDYNFTQDSFYSSEELEFIDNRVKDSQKSIYYSDQSDQVQCLSAGEMHFNALNRYKGYLCSAGQNFGKLDHKGRLFRSNCQQKVDFLDFNLCGDKIEFPKEPMVCEMSRCTDLLDLSQPKVHPSIGVEGLNQLREDGLG